MTQRDSTLGARLFQRYSAMVAGGRASLRAVRLMAGMLFAAAPGWAAAMALLTLIQAAVPPLNIWLTKRIVNVVAEGLGIGSLGTLLLIYVVLHLTAAGLAPTLHATETLLNLHLTGHVTTQVLDKVNSFTELAWFEDPTFYDDVKRISEGAPHLPRRLLRPVVELAQSVLPAIGLSLLLATLHPLIPFVLLAAMLPGIVVARHHASVLRTLERTAAGLQRRQDYWYTLGTSATSAREVLLLGMARWLRDRFKESLDTLDERRWRLRSRLLRQTLVTLGLRFAGTVATFVYLIARGVSGHLTPGDFVLFLGSLLLLDRYLDHVPLWIREIIEGSDLIDRYLAFLQLSEERPDNLAKLPAGSLRRGIEVQNLSFGYPGRDAEKVLHDVSFQIRPGETIALVGKNGAGKTTLVKLLMGLYRPSSGRILCDGLDLSSCDSGSVRVGMAAVFQDYCRYFLTAGENIALGRIEQIADPERIARAARDGGSEPFIQRLAHGYETPLGKEFGGTELSGGEWQKLALSRAFMRDADLLILDEPTAALDVRTEAEIYQHFQRLLGGRTGLLISHRFSTVRMADRILVLEGGCIVEEGTHDSLMARGGLYAEMFRMQAEAFLTAGEVA
jgi:ATP-binding cassette subfamily B protein